MTRRRRWGTGSIDVTGAGRFRVRVRVNGKRRTVGVFDTRDEAESVLRGALDRLAAGEVVASSMDTLATYSEGWLDEREKSVRDIANDRGRWKRHVVGSELGSMPLDTIRGKHVRAFVLAMLDKVSANDASETLDRGTVKHVLTLVRVCLEAAVADDLIEENPAAGIRVPSDDLDGDDEDDAGDEPWTYLTPAEQAALLTCEAIPGADRLLLGFAIGTGLRQGELWNLETRDVHVDDDHPEGDHVFVRYGGFRKGRRLKPKSGKTRRVPLFGLALEAARAWKRALPLFAQKNPRGLLFPTAGGARRQRSKYDPLVHVVETGARLPRFHALLALAGITRPVRFHDMRHTCASALVAGWWGRRWSLIEVRDMLGHSSVRVTEKYAHLAPSALTEAASLTGAAWATNGPRGALSCAPEALFSSVVSAGGADGARTRGLRRDSSTPSQQDRALVLDRGPIQARSRTLAVAFLDATRAGRGPEAFALADQLAAEVLGRDVVRLAIAIRDRVGPTLTQAIELAELVLAAVPLHLAAGEGGR